VTIAGAGRLLSQGHRREAEPTAVESGQFGHGSIQLTVDTYISFALTRGVNIPWLEQQTGVRYETMLRHYGQFLRSEGASQLAKLDTLAPDLALDADREGVSTEDYEVKVVRGGGLEPPRPFGH
jgi:hypothetical protein